MNIPHRKIIHHSAKFWQEQMNNWKTSGLTQPQFCQQNDLAISTFHKWQKKLRHEGQSELEQKHPEPFIELPTESFNHSEPEKQWDIELSLGNGVILRMRQV